MERKIKWNELILDGVLFLISCLNTNFVYVFFLVVFLKIKEGAFGFLKMNMLFLLRQCIYLPGIAAVTAAQSNIKLALLAVAAVYVILSYLSNHKGRVPAYLIPIFLFGILATISALFCGSYPVAGVIKVASFALVFMSTVLAVTECKREFDVGAYIYVWLTIVIFASCLLMPFEAAYANGSVGLMFRGIWNHPNDLGVICTVYLAMALVRCKEIKRRQVCQITVVFVIIFLTRSRGAIISAACTVILYGWMCRSKADRKILTTMIVAIAILLVASPLGDTMSRFFFKNSGMNVLSIDVFTSREEIFETSVHRFESNPWLGRGLLIPYIPGYVSYAISAEGIEPGNIFLEVLAGTGLVGFTFFLFLIWRFFRLSKGRERIYPLVAVVASISEVSFFSVNNYAFIYYILIAMSIVSLDRLQVEAEKKCTEAISSIACDL